MPKLFNNPGQKGIALVEVIVALGISLMVITSLVSLSIFTLRTSTQSKLLLEGTKTANSEMELIRAYRDTSVSWEAFVNDTKACNTGCSIDRTNQTIDYASAVQNAGTLEEITRVFYVTTPAGGELLNDDQVARITVTISWRVGAQTKSTSVYTDLTNWRGL